jgi:hypothetical protein
LAFQNLVSELNGACPKMPIDYCFTLINRALLDIYKQSLWSFQVFESNWTLFVPIQAGTCTVTQGSNSVTFDSTASTALIAANAGPSFFSSAMIQRQFRIGIGTIYRIWGYAVNTGIVTITLDRPYQETSAAGSTYQVYQCYLPAPYAAGDFRSWISIRDIINYNDMIFTETRANIDKRDPQRSIYYVPTHVVPYQLDNNPASPTFNYQLFELWGQPNFALTYQLYGIRLGTPLVNATDTIPPALGEDCVIALAKRFAYEWMEANKGDVPRGAGSDYRFLIGETMAEYQRLYKLYRKNDREVMDNFRVTFRRRPGWPSIGPDYSGIAGVAWPGAAF